jgi:hypothetical protein
MVASDGVTLQYLEGPGWRLMMELTCLENGRMEAGMESAYF